VLPETILHSLELFHAIHTLRFGFRVDETRKGGFEVLSTWSICHTSEALFVSISRVRNGQGWETYWTIPVDFTGFLVESSLWSLLLLSLGRLLFKDGRCRCSGSG